MAPPRRLTYLLIEAAARWDCSTAEIMDWALGGKIEICCIVAFAMTTNGEYSGLKAVSAAEVMHMYRRDGMGLKSATVRRIRHRNSEGPWAKITEPEEGIEVDPFDIIITTDAIEAFEAEHEIGPRPRNCAGGTARWDWEEFYSHLLARIYKQGLPEKQKDLIEEMQNWFERRSDSGDAPDVSTIRKRIAAVWREIQEE